MHMFDDRLQVTLTLNIGTSTFSAAAGAIQSIELEAWVYGFEASVTFRVSSESEADALFDQFLKPDVMKATLALANGGLGMEGEVAEVSTWLGYVTERSVRETTSADLSGTPIIERLYALRFADAARVFWREHRPLSVYAGKSYKDVFDANLVQGVSLEYDLSALEQAHDVLAVGLGAGARASFYDYWCSVISDSVGVIELDEDAPSCRPGDALTVGLRPEKIALSHDEPAQSVNKVAGEIWDIGYLGDMTMVQVMVGGDEGKLFKVSLTNRTRRIERPFAWEDKVWLAWDVEAGMVLAS